MKKIVDKIGIKQFILLILCILIASLYYGINYIASRNFQVTVSKNINVGDSVEDNFSATFKGKDVTDKVEVVSNIYKYKTGKYQVTFIYHKKNKTYQTVKKIEIIDKKAPVLKLLGSKETILVKGQNYKEPGFTAIDNYDGDITNQVVVTGNINNKKLGTYKLKYTVKDNNNNKTTSTRKIIVINKSPLDMDIEEFTLNKVYPSTILKKTKEASISYIDSFSFIGDSNNIIFKNAYYNKLSIDNNNFLNYSNISLNELLKKKKNNKLIITIGFDSLKLNKEKFINSYRNILSNIKDKNPDTLLIVQSIFPTEDKQENKKINDYNYYILEMCSELEIPFLNTASVLKNNEGCINQDYISNNNINEKGKNIITKYILEHAIIEE